MFYSVDGDMLPDLLAVIDDDNQRYVWKSSSHRNFTKDGRMFKDHTEPFSRYSSNAFIDVTQDGAAGRCHVLYPLQVSNI